MNTWLPLPESLKWAVVGQWSKTYIKINKNGLLTKNQGLTLAIPVPWLESHIKIVGWTENQHGPQNGKDLKRFCIEEWPQIPYPCILQTHQSEKIQSCYLGKGRQHKVLTKRVPVIVAHKFIKDICFLIKLCCVCNCLYSVRESFLLIFCTKDQKVKQ